MSDEPSEGRRRFLRMVPAAVAGAIAAPALAQQAPADLAITKDTLDCGEKIFGVDFTEPEEEAIVRGVNRNLDSFEALRKVDIPLDTDIPLVFHPYLPGQKPKPGATPGAALKVMLAPPAPRRASLDDLAFQPITALAPLLRSREVSATDLTRMYLARLKKYGPKLNCVVTLTEDLALKQAADADREIKAGRYKGPLHGIPWGAKDLFATKGIPTTWGAGPYQDQVFDYDATIVSRLHDAGAVLLAKLSMGALAQGDQWFRGQTKNPWRPDDPNPNRSGSSGSSAGPGSATAAGLVVFGIGTETRGSIISPSSVNGVTGLRPTYGRVSRFGAMMLSWTMDKVGPMCRSVEDCALVFNAIYGPDGKDDSVVDAPFAWNPDLPLSKLRIGVIQRDFQVQPPGGGRAGAAGAGAAAGRGAGGGGGRGGVSAEEFRRQREAQLKILNDALEVYRKLGATLTPIEQVPGTDIANDIGFVLNVEAAAAFDDLTRSAGINDPSVQQWANTFRTSRFVPAVEYIRAQRARTLLMRQWDEFMSQYDVFLSPAGGSTLGITNLTGHPALAMKAGFNDGAPVELMVTGRLYDEATVLRVALAYERATEWHTMNPKMDWA
ncbi:MAG TPA: amidase [Vicinamibacterales bacterium]|jgi:Asp-tRNA(Asn)/Glu-tRNA(Gln) amidotransferase A subunit family amidase|nr:amidase [Vicinamibacterales bacterium]